MNTLIFSDKNTLEVLPYSVDFSDRLLVGESISTPYLTILVASGDDPNPATLIQVGPAVVGNTITFSLTGGIPGTIYLIAIGASISSGNYYLKVAYLAIVASDPFASS